MRYVGVLFVCAVSTVVAQPPAGQGPSPQMMAQFQRFLEENKFQFQLGETFRKLGELERKGGATALTKDQAKKLLALFKPMTQKDKLTPEEAKKALKEIKAILRPDQLAALDRIQLPRMRFGGRPGGAGGGPGGGPGGPGGGAAGPGGPGFGGQGGAGGPRMGRFDPTQLRNINPLSVKVDKDSPFAEFQKKRAERINEFLSHLEKKAK
ncbi:MAG: hypothetical protein NZ959_03305 [Armatimonadetes bacterium]|nr:hypothetical protein [Armatimonadota bacterium]MDW8121313.1 hypothetical protein [Armatimonadota bacterium]